MSSENFPQIPNYKIEHEIARGGMAVVYKGKHVTLDRPVAIKLLKPDMMGNQTAINRFLKEPKILARFSHPNIVTIYDSGFLEDSQNQLYLVMEYLPGGSLKSKMQQGRLPVQRVIIIVKAIADALNLAHSKGVIHRDIKPDNILFQENGAPVLTDFGVAKDLDSNTQATTAGTLLGTYRYMSPEQFQELELDGRSDLFSLGILLVEMLTGERPYDANSVESLITKRLTEPVPELPDGFHEFQPTAERLLTKDRNQRFASAGELVQALQQLEITLGFVKPEADIAAPSLTHTPTAIDTEPKPVQRRSSRRWLFAGVAAAVIVGVGIFFVPAVLQSLQIRDLHAAINKQITTIEQQLTDLKNQQSYPQDLASAKTLLQDLQQQSTRIQSEIATGEQQHRQALQAIEQQKTSLEQTLSEHQASLEQQQARFEKESINEENTVSELRAQLTMLEQEADKATAEHEQRIGQLQQEQKTLRRQIGDEQQKIAQLQQQHTADLSTEQAELAQLQQQLESAQTQHQELLAALSNQDGDLVTRLEQTRTRLAQEQKNFETAKTGLAQKIAAKQKNLEDPEKAIQALKLGIEAIEKQRLAVNEQTQQTASKSDAQLADLQKQQESLYRQLQDEQQKTHELTQQHEQALSEKRPLIKELQTKLEQSTTQLSELQEQFHGQRSELAEATAEAQQQLEQTQLDIQELTKTVEILKQDDQTLAQSTRKNLDIVNLMVAKLQQDMEPFIAKYQTSPDMENRIAELLGKAESAFRKRNFTTPRSDNVVMWAEEVLKLDTDNAQAKEAISKVIDTYLDWAWLPQAGSLQHYFTAAQEQRFKELNSRPSSTGNNRPRSSGSRRSEPEEKKGWFEQWFQGNNEN